LKKPIDETPTDAGDFLREIKEWFFEAEWHQIYDLIEFMSAVDDKGEIEEFVTLVNRFLEEEKSAYRLVGGQITAITSDEEIAEVDAAVKSTGKFEPASTHLSAALRFYSNRKDPDYRNSVKESISAVESVVKLITGDSKAGIGAALAVVQKKHSLHPALKEALSKLYGYTSDEDGIRHAILESPSVDEADARFMLVICSAFVNLLVQRAGK
jgi:hypothetical protein